MYHTKIHSLQLKLLEPFGSATPKLNQLVFWLHYHFKQILDNLYGPYFLNFCAQTFFFLCSKTHGMSMKNAAKPQSVNQLAQVKQASTCDYCTDKKPTSESDLSYHLNSKHIDKIPSQWLNCSVCVWRYPSQEKFDIHRRNHSNEESLPTNVEIQCQFCPEVFLKFEKRIYYKHANDFHSEELADWHQCSTCNLNYPTNISLARHTWFAILLLFSLASGKARDFDTITKSLSTTTSFFATKVL